MASSKLLPFRRFSKFLQTPSFPSSPSPRPRLPKASRSISTRFTFAPSSAVSPPSISFSSPTSTVDQGPSAIDYRSLLQENEFHNLADSTIHNLQEKLEEYGDTAHVEGFDIDYGNEVLTLKAPLC